MELLLTSNISVQLNNRLEWRNNTDTAYNKETSRLFSEEAQIFQCMQQESGDLLPLCGGECHSQSSSLQGWQHQ